MAGCLPGRAAHYPALRYMGSKLRLLGWLAERFGEIDFETAFDPFCGSGCVAYLLKSMGKSVWASDALAFPAQIARAVIENPGRRLSAGEAGRYLEPHRRPGRFIERTFGGIFFGPADLRFLDNAWAHLDDQPDGYPRSLALAGLVLACARRQPRGVFTVAGDPERYKDGRRQLRTPLAELFLEACADWDRLVTAGGPPCRAWRGDALAPPGIDFDLVYLDPPYAPRSDDNCYVKRYHFLEGLISCWRDPDARPQPGSKVRKIAKRATPFGSRRQAGPAFERLFALFPRSTLALSQGGQALPPAGELIETLRRQGRRVAVHRRPHRYSFGTHARVRPERAQVEELLIVAGPKEEP